MSKSISPQPASTSTTTTSTTASPSPAPSSNPSVSHSAHSTSPPLSVPSPASTSSQSKNKPVNVFTNDGSFLERFQRTKREEEERRKEKDALERKKYFDDRFKKRGKRPALEPGASADTTPEDEQPSKKAKHEEQPISEYQKELNNLSVPSLKDTGNGVRPLVK